MRREIVDLANSIKASQLQVPLAETLCLSLHQTGLEALSSLAEHNYDFAPVLVKSRPRYWIARAALEGPGVRTVNDVKQRIEPELLISADATIGDLVGGFEGQPFLFVLDGRTITGVVTPSDLNKQPARTYFFLRIAEFESHIALIVRERVGDDLAFGLLTPERRAVLERIRAQARAENRELGWISYFYLADLLEVVRQRSDVRSLLGDPNEGHWNTRTEGLAGVRNASVHLVRDLIDANRTPAVLDRIDRNLSELLTRARAALPRG